VSNSKPLGIYDSGVGGLTVWRSIRSRLPLERVIYYADTAHLPYGGRPEWEIQQFSRDIIGFLAHRGVKLVVAACNTSSALALPSLAPHVPVPVVGMIEPVLAEAARVTRAGRVGLLATEGTVRSGVHAALLAKVAPDIRLFGQSCPRLVPLIEAGATGGAELAGALREYAAPLLAARVDCVILGCTHYPIIRAAIQAALGPQVVLIDPALAVARRVEDLLGQGVGHNAKGTGEDAVYVSGDVGAFSATATALGYRLASEARQAELGVSTNGCGAFVGSPGGFGMATTCRRAGAQARGGVAHAVESKAGSRNRPRPK
jgi:glutamate racemase